MFNEIIFLIVVIFVLNVIWEFSHEKLYDWNRKPLKNNWNFKLKRLFQSCCGDVVLVGFIFGIVFMFKERNWIFNPSGLDYLFVGSLGLIVAWGMEKYSIGKRWNYLDKMPKLFGVGVSPLIQLSATAIIALWIFVWFF